MAQSAEKPSREQISRVLVALREEAMDGYKLMVRTGLDEEQLTGVIRYLDTLDLVTTKGELTAKDIGRAYVWIPPSIRGKAEALLDTLTSSAF